MRALGWRAGAGAAQPEARLGMSGTGRAVDGPEAIPDVPRRETAGGVNGGTILTEARARRERALAYRVAVDAVYPVAELAVVARRPGDGQASGYPAAECPGIAANGTGPAGMAPGRGRRARTAVMEACREPDRTHDLITRWKHWRSLNSGLASGSARSAMRGSACPGRCWRCSRSGRRRSTTMPSGPPRRRSGSWSA
jgi:hypothetical protein